MNLKKVFIKVILAILLITFMVIPQNVFAETVTGNDIKILGRIPKRESTGFAYSIGGAPEAQEGGSTTPGTAILWNIIKYDDDSNTSYTYNVNNDMFCLNAKYGVWGEPGTPQSKLKYDTYFDMKTARQDEDFIALSTREDLSKIVGDNYNALLALGDLLYIKGQSEQDKSKLLESAGIVYDDEYYEEYIYKNPLTHLGDKLLEDDDIWAVEQAAIWYFTNGSEDEDNDGEKDYDKTASAQINGVGLLSYSTSENAESDPNSYNNLGNYEQSTNEGLYRQKQAGILYNYLIETAKNNASNYEDSTTTVPPVTVTAQSQYEEIDSRYIIGPIKIQETSNKLPYAVGNFTVKNGNTTITDYNILYKSGNEFIETNDRGNDLVGTESNEKEFYISVSTEGIENVSVSANISYSKTKLELWTSGSTNTNQPILIPTKEYDSIPLRLNIVPNAPKIFDLALRKYITKVNGTELTGTNSRIPDYKDDISKLNTIQNDNLITTATYKHRKDPVLVKTNDKVTYTITIYNEGEKAGKATKIVDQLPAEVEFLKTETENIGGSNNNYTFEYDEAENKVTITAKDSLGNLSAYTGNGQLANTSVQVVCKVTAQPHTTKPKVLTNIAWISEAYDAEDESTYLGTEIGHDRDSAPGTHPQYNKNNISDYTGNGNKDDLSDSGWFYKGQQDDDDFEKLVLEPKSFDLALRKYITKVTSGETTKVLSNLNTTTRIPDINESTIASQTKTATYNHRKDPVTVETGNTVTYNITIYNEGEKAGRATKVVDQLPTGLEFSRVVSGNFELDSYNKNTDNILNLKRIEGNTTNLPAYAAGNLTSGTGSETIEIECIVTAKPDTENNKILTNIAWISEEIDEYGTKITNQVGADRDSEPNTHPNVINDNLPDYRGNSENDNLALNNPSAYFKGEQDDDDFEKLVILPKSFDLALRKYITKVKSGETTTVLSNSNTTTRNPVIDESTIASETTTATYKHRKDPVTVKTGDTVTYNITIYNEGERAGRATKVVDQLPIGLEFSRVVSGNFELDSYNKNTDNVLNLKRVEGNTTNLPAYVAGNLTSGTGSETIEIECIVTAKPYINSNDEKILTNIAWISEEIDEYDTIITNQVGADRDSEPSTHPNVANNNLPNYRGNSENDNLALNNPAAYFKGEQDDDDFEKLVLKPEIFDLKLIKSIVKVNEKTVRERLNSIDVSKLNIATNAKTTADYRMDKNPVSVAKGDIVTYRLRVYNEGTIDGYASEITEDIPEGLEFIFVAEGEEASEEEKAASDFNMENGWVYADTTFKTIKTTNLALHPLINGEPDSLSHTDNLIKAFGRNDGTKTSEDLSYKDIFVKMKVVSENVTGITIRNEAAITEDSDEDGNDIEDRDSTPEEWKKEDSDEYYDDEQKWKKYKEDDEDYDNIILKPFDLALRKFIIAVSDDEKIDNDEYLKDENGQYTRAPQVDTSKLNTQGEDGKIITTAIYNHPKEPVKVKKNDIVVYMLRVYNEGEMDGYAAEIKDHLPPYLEFVEGEFNEKYGWDVSEDGRTVTTTYLANQKISAATPVIGGVTADGPVEGFQPYVLAYKEVPIMCKVKDTAKVNEKITNIADITEYLDENEEPVNDRDSEKDNVDLPKDEDLPGYKDDETGDYIPGQEDDDDFEKIIIPRYDLALRKQIISIYNTYKNQNVEYNDRFAKLDKTQKHTIYDYYDVDANKPTVVEGDIVTYSIRVYNEGEVDGKALYVTDRLPSGLEYLPDNEINKKYEWKAYKESQANAENAMKIGEKYYEEVGFDSKEIYMYATEYLKDTTIKAYTGEGEASYAEVRMATKVKAKKEVAEGTEYKLRNIAEIGEDDGEDEDSTPGDENEWKEEDDLDVEDLKLVEFDLALRKWVTEAIVIENGEWTVTPTGHQPYDDPEQVVKVELHRRKLSQVVVKFRYSIRVINEGQIAGYAKEVTDYIPQGLKFLAEDNEGWTDEGNNVISTKKLENTLLQPGEYADVEVILTWENSENNMGVMVNTAEISQDENEYGVPDIDSVPDNKKPGEDDIDDAPVMLSITTGQVRIYFTLGFVVLGAVAGGVVLIKKFVL